MCIHGDEMRHTRGMGMMENFLSRWRAMVARRELNNGATLLDVGCGRVPHFAISTNFRNKYLLDPAVSIHTISSLQDIECGVDCVTMLAVLEHMTHEDGQEMIREVHARLNSRGVLVITTPNKWTKSALEVLAKLNVVSPEEIGEHRFYYDKHSLRGALHLFDRIHVKPFMFGMNLVARAIKY